MDDITEAVLSRDEVARFLAGSHGRSGDAARQRVLEYLEELRTTQRYELYRALEYPLYPILRKIERVAEHAENAVAATARGRVVWASNHRSHTDYLVEPLVLDDAGVRPPIIAAGINLFGGPLGLIHKHVTGALPIRRNTKDPAYLITLKAYIGTILHKHDLFFYPEGGRSYSGEIKSPKTGLFSASLSANVSGLVIVPVAVAYDLVLEDHVLARQRVKRTQRAFSRELAEMVRYAVGYRSRAFVTFGRPIPLEGYDPESRRSVLIWRTWCSATSGDSTRWCRRPCSPPGCGRRLPGASSGTGSRPSSTRCAPPAPTWRCRLPTRCWTRPPSRSRPAASSPWSTAPTGSGSGTCCATTVGASSTSCHMPARRTEHRADSA